MKRIYQLSKFDHDELFRALMDIPNVARECFEAHLPEDVKQGINFLGLTILKVY